MARACVEQSHGAAAIIIVHGGVILRMYRRDGRISFIEAGRGQFVPVGSAFHDSALASGSTTPMDECEPDVWLGHRSARTVEILEEQVLFQRDGFAMILLRAELRDED